MHIFGVDAETDGLYGPVWAIGAVVLDQQGVETDHFCGQIDPSCVKDSWVIKHVVPVVHLPRYRSARELRDAFWTFWMSYRETCACVADTRHPVEFRLFRDLHDDDPVNRDRLDPVPIHEMCTAELFVRTALDLDGLMVPGLEHSVRHNPLHDARIAARTFYHALDLIRPRR